MSDKWKKFTEDHQEEFNSDSPSDSLFERIQPEIVKKDEPRMIRLSIVIQMAAAFLILIGLSLFFVWNNKSEVNSNLTTAKVDKIKDDRMVLSKINPELAETEYYFINQIDELMKEVETNQLTPEVKLILEQLDAEFNLLKSEMGEQVNSDKIIEALIENYRLKIKLLQKLLNSDNTNSENYEKEIHT
jgi:hypothetical protein